MDGLVFVRSLLGAASMPMAEHVHFVLDEVTAGCLRGWAARLFDCSGTLFAGARSTSIVARE
jgi:hypothetical protein